MSIFKAARMGTAARVTTVLYFLALGYFIASAGLALLTGAAPVLFDLVAGAFLLAMIVYGLVRSAGAYEVTPEEVIVRRVGPGRLHVPLSRVRRVSYKPEIGSFFSERILGLGALFGWAGPARVRNPRDVESMQAEVYGSNPAKAVVLELEEGRAMVLTPADPEGLVAAVQDRITRPAKKNVKRET